MTEVQWRVPTRVPVGKLIVAAMFILLAVVAATLWWQVTVALLAAGGVALWAGRDLFAPVRVAADQFGITLRTGIAGRVRLLWPQVEKVRVDARRRSRLLEVDAGETIYLFSRYELDADLDEVAARLEHFRTGRPEVY